MDVIPLAPSEAEALAAIGLATMGALSLLGGFWLVTAAPRMRANPGDALIGLGLVLCLASAHITRQDGIALWTAGAAAFLRTVFAFGHYADERHHPTGRDGETPEQRRSRRARRDRRIAEETVRRYEEALRTRERERADAPEPIDITPAREADADGPPRAIVEDAVYRDVEDAPSRVDEGEILIRFETPIDAADVAARPDRARVAMEAVLRQLGDGSRIVGIRARR